MPSGTYAGIMSDEMRFPAKIRSWFLAWVGFPKSVSQVLVKAKPKRNENIANLTCITAILMLVFCGHYRLSIKTGFYPAVL